MVINFSVEMPLPPGLGFCTYGGTGIRLLSSSSSPGVQVANACGLKLLCWWLWGGPHSGSEVWEEISGLFKASGMVNLEENGKWNLVPRAWCSGLAPRAMPFIPCCFCSHKRGMRAAQLWYSGHVPTSVLLCVKWWPSLFLPPTIGFLASCLA